MKASTQLLRKATEPGRGHTGQALKTSGLGVPAVPGIAVPVLSGLVGVYVCVCVQLYACIQAYVYVLYMFNFLTIISLNREETLHTLELQRNIFIKKDTSGMGEGWQRETVVSSVWYVSRGV